MLICTAHAQNGYLCTSGVNLDTAVRFADPDFLLGCKISAIRRCFTLIFALNIPSWQNSAGRRRLMGGNIGSGMPPAGRRWAA